MGNKFDYPGNAKAERAKVIGMLKKPRRKVNVLVVGKPGAGKSSLVTSLESCLTQTYGMEVGSAGRIENSRVSFTFRLRKYSLFTEDNDLGINHYDTLNLFDMPGLQNFKDDRTMAIMTAILKGRVPVNEPILVTAGMTAEDIENTYSGHQDEAENRIDRAIFVHSCKETIPDNLVDAVTTVCNNEDVTVFTLLSHIDEKSHIIKEDDLASALGTVGSPRGCEVALYRYKKSDRGNYEAIPRTDFFLLKLWQALMNPRYPINSTSQ